MTNVLAENVTIKLKVDDTEARAQLARARSEAGGGGPGRAATAPGGVNPTLAQMPGGAANAAQAASTASLAHEAGRTLTMQARQPRGARNGSLASAADDMAAAWAAMPGRTSWRKPVPALNQAGTVRGLTNPEVIAAMERAGVGLPSRLSSEHIAEAYTNRQFRVQNGHIPVPSYFDTKPQVPSRLYSLADAALGRLGGAMQQAGRFGNRLLRRGLANAGAGLSLAGALAFAREVSAQRNDYFREYLSNPNSTIAYKPYSNAATRAFETFAEFQVNAWSTAAFGLLGGGVEAVVGLFGDSAGMKERRFGLALSMGEAAAAHFMGLTEGAWREAADKGQQQIAAFNRLREQAFKEAVGIAHSAAARAEKLGIGTRSREEIENTLARDPAFRNRVFEKAARKFFRDNPIGDNTRNTDPHNVMKS